MILIIRLKLLVLTIVVCLFVLPCLIVKANNSDQSELFEKAGQAFNRGNYDEAIEASTKAIELDPNYISYYNRGVVYRGKKQFDLAIKDFSKAIDLKPNEAEAYFSRGLSFDGNGQFELAIIDYNKVIYLNQKNVSSAYEVRGLIYCKQGKYDLAIADFNKTIEASPTSFLAYNFRGSVYGLLGKYDDAIRDFNQCIQDFPYYIAMFNLAQALELKGNRDEAIIYYKKSLPYLSKETKAKEKAEARLNDDWDNYIKWIYAIE